MQTSAILHRVADFLRKHAPFDALPEANLLALVCSGRVKSHQSEEYVFRQGDTKGSLVWVIQQGRERLCDVLGPGGLLGLDRFVDEGVSRYSHRTCTDVIFLSVDAPCLSPR